MEEISEKERLLAFIEIVNEPRPGIPSHGRSITLVASRNASARPWGRRWLLYANRLGEYKRKSSSAEG